MGGDSSAAGVGDGTNPAQLVVPTTKAEQGSAVPSACTGQLQVAHEAQVDMYIMLDRSGSMQEKTGAGPSKWEAIGQALRDFVDDPQSAGLAVGLQYFPLGKPGVPDSCSADSDCGEDGACASKACLPSAFGGSSLAPCFTDADCPLLSQGCAPFGTCTGDATLACFNIGPGGCQDQGDCVRYQGTCTNYSSCNADDYAQPAVPLGSLPHNAPLLVASLSRERPLGNTPTPVALSGALGFARTQATANPDHRVIAVLATDGLPTDCLGSQVQTEAQAVRAIADIATQARMASPSIPTYVIGVFAPDDSGAKMNLQELAVAGGTKQAFFVDQSQDVTKQLLAALASIRGGSLACQYALPQAPAGQSLDFNAINVQLTTSDHKTQNVLYVADSSQCGKAQLGWYYDADPKQGATPSKINMCPATCDHVRALTGATLQIELGCATLSPS